MIKTLKKLLPRGLAWLVPAGYMRALLDGIALSFDRLADFLETVATEANPATAVNCLEEWFDQYGMPWTEAGSDQSKQEDALSRYISTGDQDIVYLQRMIDEAGFTDITVYETPRSRVTATIDVAPTNAYGLYPVDLSLYLGQTIEVGVWIRNVDLDQPVMLDCRAGAERYGTTGWFSLDGLGNNLITFQVTIPLIIPPDQGYFVIDTSDGASIPTAGTSFIVSDGYVGELQKVEAPDWLWQQITPTLEYFVSPEIFEFFLEGSVNNFTDSLRLATLIQRLSPAHCEPNYTDVIEGGNVWGEGLYGDAVCSGR